MFQHLSALSHFTLQHIIKFNVSTIIFTSVFVAYVIEKCIKVHKFPLTVRCSTIGSFINFYNLPSNFVYCLPALESSSLLNVVSPGPLSHEFHCLFTSIIHVVHTAETNTHIDKHKSSGLARARTQIKI